MPKMYPYTWAGQTVLLTEAQLNAMMRGLAVNLSRQASHIKGLAEVGKDTQKSHVENTNSAVRSIVDAVGGASLPPEAKWNVTMQGAQSIIDELAVPNLTPDLISRQPERLKNVASNLDDAESAWREYITGTIAGAETTVRVLEVVRDVSFGIAAGLAAAVAAPVFFAWAGGGALGVAAGIGGGALTLPKKLICAAAIA